MTDESKRRTSKAPPVDVFARIGDACARIEAEASAPGKCLRAVAGLRTSKAQPDRVAYLESGIAELAAHHAGVADEEQVRIDSMPVDDKIRERLIGKRKLRQIVSARLQDLLDGNLIVRTRNETSKRNLERKHHERQQ